MKYRSLPQLVDAIQWTGDNYDQICAFYGDSKWIGTVNINEWIIKGIKGEFYPCKPDIFEATYEPVELSDKAEGSGIFVTINMQRREISEKEWDRMYPGSPPPLYPGSPPPRRSVMKKVYLVMNNDNLFAFSTRELAQEAANKLKDPIMSDYTVDEAVDWQVGSIYTVDVSDGLVYPCIKGETENQFRHPHKVVVSRGKTNHHHIISPISFDNACMYALEKKIANRIGILNEYEFPTGELGPKDILVSMLSGDTPLEFMLKSIAKQGKKMGFIPYTISLSKKGFPFFMAVPVETATQENSFV